MLRHQFWFHVEDFPLDDCINEDIEQEILQKLENIRIGKRETYHRSCLIHIQSYGHLPFGRSGVSLKSRKYLMSL